MATKQQIEEYAEEYLDMAYVDVDMNIYDGEFDVKILKMIIEYLEGGDV